ncbi:MAG TPA: hypothetical protein DCW42_01220 [Bacteroidetes bacterium]|nr:hypothetical protein [Bacteroidota bacterium]
MRKEEYTIKSEILERKMRVVVYGHSGVNFLFFPITEDDPYEYEKIKLIASLEPLINKGRIKIFSTETNNLSSWLDQSKSPKERSDQHYFFNSYLTNELVKFIYSDNGSAVPIITVGEGIGAFHSVNSYLRRPDMFSGTVGVNGFYDIQWLSGTYYDENCYFNSPLHYLPNLTDDYWLSFLQSQKHITLGAQEGNWDMVNQANRLAEILTYKNIPFEIKIIDCSDCPNEDINKVMLEKILLVRY